ncbi:thiaminase II [Aerococcus christensenii]|uniref:thiaminase II n=1 Tax=Aerococcus christensenii TaxID=87541 RepID=UPI003F41CF91
MKQVTDIMEEKALPIIDKIYHDGFIQGIVTATLPKVAVEHYLKADALYLENFSDIYALLLAKSENKDEKNFFLSQINFVLNEEIAAHQTLAKYIGRDYHSIIQGGEWYPTADHYIKHMYYNAYAYGMAETLSAMAPCPWVYKKVAEKILQNHTLADSHPLKDWVTFYADGLVDECLSAYYQIINRLAETMNETQKKRLVKNFLESCEHERKFFNMAFTQERWELEG